MVARKECLLFQDKYDYWNFSHIALPTIIIKETININRFKNEVD